MSRIHVSSTFKDLKSPREKVRVVLRRLGHEDVAMEYYGASEQRPVEKCLQDVASCDLYIGIFAWRHGYVPEGYDKSVTELEYRKAIETGKDCLIFLIAEDAPWPVNQVEVQAINKINALREELSATHMVDFFKSEDDLKALVSQAVSNWERRHGINSKRGRADWAEYRRKVFEEHQWVRLTVIAGAKHDQIARIPLVDVFVPQTAKPGLPTYEVPDEVLEFKRRLFNRDSSTGTTDTNQESEVEDNSDSDEQIPDSEILSEPVTDIFARENTQVVLGGPGSGKSSLLHYALLHLCGEANDEDSLFPNLNGTSIPFLIELRQYVLKKFTGFIEYIVQNSKDRYGVDLDVESVQEILRDEKRALVMFDGLEEIFDPVERDRVIQQFKTFSRQYPQARVIVTSRIVGYDSSDLGVEGFQHYTLLDFNVQQVRQFIPNWYQYYTWEGDYRDAASLIQRIQESPRLGELAGNPLLLTMMAIIYKHQDLPEQRWKLYERCTEVLLEDWDIKRKSIERKQLLPADVNIIAPQKAEILQLVSIYMLEHGQAGRELNAIAFQPLMSILAKYLEQKFNKSRGDAEAIARDILSHLRERTYILAEIGEGIFGFVHRTFMEYFAASYHQSQFNAKRADYKWLTEEIFGAHWQEDEWQEVLLLLIAMIADQGSPIVEVIDYLRLNCQVDPPLSLAFAARCLAEAGDMPDEKLAQELLVELVDSLVSYAREYDEFKNLNFINAGLTALSMLGPMFQVPGAAKKAIRQLKKKSVKMRGKMLAWQMNLALRAPRERLDFAIQALHDKDQVVRRGAIVALEREWAGDTEIEKELLEVVREDPIERVSQMAANVLRISWQNNSTVIDAIESRNGSIPRAEIAIPSIKELAANWQGNLKALSLIMKLAGRNYAVHDMDLYRNSGVVNVALEAIGKGWESTSEAIQLLHSYASDQDPKVRLIAIRSLAEHWPNHSDTLPLLLDKGANDDSFEIRSICLMLLAGLYPRSVHNMFYMRGDYELIPEFMMPIPGRKSWRNHPLTIALLHDRVQNDSDERVRQVATGILEERRNYRLSRIEFLDPYSGDPQR